MGSEIPFAMSELRRGQFSFPGLCFTKLERHFFLLLRQSLQAACSDLHIYAARYKGNPSLVELLVKREREQQKFRVRVYGLRPVSYQLESEGRDELSREFREIVFGALGEANFRRSAGGQHHWSFQVRYSEAVVKTLG